MDSNGICRLCLNITDNFRDLISAKNDKTTLEVIHKIDELFQIQSLDDRQLPHAICRNCEKTLIQCYEFHMMVFKNQQKLLTGLLCSSKTLLEENSLSVSSETPIDEASSVVEVLPSEVNIEYLLNVVDPENCIEIDEGQVESDRDTEHEDLDISSRQEHQKELEKVDFDDENRKIKEFYDFSCLECDEKSQFENINAFRSHMKNAHKIHQAGIHCCKRKLTTRNALLSHLTLHIDPDKFKCSQCQKQCRDKEKLQLHIVQYHSSFIERKYQCDKCPKRFASNYNLKKHSFVHLDANRKQELKQNHMCSLCGHGFLSKSILAHHFRQMHENKYACVCDICAKSFKSKGNFINHYQNQHMNRFGRRQQCTFCGQWLSDKSSLKRHVQNLHNKYGPYICEICQKETPTENALKSHQKYVHFDVKRFSCDQCGKAFKKEIALKEHIMTHIDSTVGLYQCPFCDKSFNSSANMCNHKKKIHPIDYEKSKQSSL